jgi:hypothetical protein
MEPVTEEIFWRYLDVVVESRPWSYVALRSSPRLSAIISDVCALGLARRIDSLLEDCVVLTCTLIELFKFGPVGRIFMIEDSVGVCYGGGGIVKVGELTIQSIHLADFTAKSTRCDDIGIDMRNFVTAVQNWMFATHYRHAFNKHIIEGGEASFTMEVIFERWILFSAHIGTLCKEFGCEISPHLRYNRHGRIVTIKKVLSYSNNRLSP